MKNQVRTHYCHSPQCVIKYNKLQYVWQMKFGKFKNAFKNYFDRFT